MTHFFTIALHDTNKDGEYEVIYAEDVTYAEDIQAAAEKIQNRYFDKLNEEKLKAQNDKNRGSL